MVNHAYMAGQKACTDPIYPGSVASHSSNIYCSTKENAIKRDKVEGDTQGLLDRIMEKWRNKTKSCRREKNRYENA